MRIGPRRPWHAHWQYYLSYSSASPPQPSLAPRTQREKRRRLAHEPALHPQGGLEEGAEAEAEEVERRGGLGGEGGARGGDVVCEEAGGGDSCARRRSRGERVYGGSCARCHRRRRDKLCGHSAPRQSL